MSDAMAYPPPPVPVSQKSGLALASLICGILTFIPCLILPSIPAVITGHMALSQIKASGDTIGGRGSALAGLIMGYIGIGLIVLSPFLAGLTAPLIIRNMQKAQSVVIIANSKTIGAALTQHAMSASPSAYPADLAELETSGTIPDLNRLLEMPKNSPGEWLYNPGADPSDSSAVLLVSPPFRNKRYVTTGDLAVLEFTVRQAEAEIAKVKGPLKAYPAPLKAR